MHVGIIVLFILRQPLFELSVGETGISPSVRFFLRQCELSKKTHLTKKRLARSEKTSIMTPLPHHSSTRAQVRQSGCSSVVERNLAKVDVVGSNPIIRSSAKSRKTTGVLAQLVERFNGIEEVSGSNPLCST